MCKSKLNYDVKQISVEINSSGLCSKVRLKVQSYEGRRERASEREKRGKNANHVIRSPLKTVKQTAITGNGVRLS
jgi:hypothetical protein